MNKLIFSSSGLKTGPLPMGKDYYIDCRAVPDPTRVVKKAADYHYAPGVSGDGSMIPVQNWIRDHISIPTYVKLISDMLKTIPSRRENNPKKDELDPVTIHTFCAYGVHRSVAMKWILAREFQLLGYTVEVK